MSSTKGSLPASRLIFDQKSLRTRFSHSASFAKEISLPRAALRRSLALSKAIIVLSSQRLKKPNSAKEIRWPCRLRKKADQGRRMGPFAPCQRRSPCEAAGHAPHRILFVCLGNICRSPMAEGVFRRVVAEEGLDDSFVIDSAGLGDWHIGQAPDHRAQKAARTRGIDISGQSARQVVDEDFDRFDLLLVMDGSNYDELKARAPHEARAKIRPSSISRRMPAPRTCPIPSSLGRRDSTTR